MPSDILVDGVRILPDRLTANEIRQCLPGCMHRHMPEALSPHDAAQRAIVLAMAADDRGRHFADRIWDRLGLDRRAGGPKGMAARDELRAWCRRLSPAAAPEPSGRWTLDNRGDPNDPSDAPFSGATWAPTESNRPGSDWIVHVDADGDLEDLHQPNGGSVSCDGDHLHTASDIIPLDALFAYLAASPDVDVEELIARMRRAQSDYDDSDGAVRR